MANEVKLEVYTFRIRKKRDKENYINLDEFDGGDMLEFFQKYLNSFNVDIVINEQRKKSLKFLSDFTRFNSKDRTISGILESGDYGVDSTILDQHTGAVKFKKNKDDLDVKPFYFFLSLPSRHNKGMVVLQRLGIYGINGIFTQHFAEFFQEKYDDYIVEFNPLISRQLAKEFIDNGLVKEITLRRYDLPDQLEDKLGLTNHKDVARIEIKIIAKSRKNLPFEDRIKRFFENPNAALFDIPALNALGFDGNHTSSVRIKSGSNTRTIDLSDTGQIRPYYDISKEVLLMENNHPEFESIDSVARQLINELMEEFYR